MAHLKNSYLRLGNNLRILKLFVTHCPTVYWHLIATSGAFYGPLPAVFSKQLSVTIQYCFLPMTGFELRTSGIGSDHSTNWATPLPLSRPLLHRQIPKYNLRVRCTDFYQNKGGIQNQRSEGRKRGQPGVLLPWPRGTASAWRRPVWWAGSPLQCSRQTWCGRPRPNGSETSSVPRLGDLLAFLKTLATINLPKSLTFLGNFCKDVKINHFSSEICFGQLL